MDKTVRDVMTTKVHTVSPRMTLADLDRAFLEKKVGGFPVVDGNKLVGLVTRSDVVRQLSVERSVAEMATSYSSPELPPEEPGLGLAAISAQVGRRLAEWTVKDLMVRDLVTLTPDQNIRDVARTFVDKRIHRAPVVENEKLVGIVTSLDLVALLA